MQISNSYIITNRTKTFSGKSHQKKIFSDKEFYSSSTSQSMTVFPYMPLCGLTHKDSKKISAKSKEQQETQYQLNRISKLLGTYDAQDSVNESLEKIYNALISTNQTVAEMANTMNIGRGIVNGNNLPENINEIQKHLGVDYKSGLYNAETLKRDIEAIKTQCKQEGIPLSFAMFDFDNFKSVNDLLNYDIGDEFIKTIGKDLSKIAESNGYKAYRFGGEEFMILMPGLSQDDATQIAQNALNVVNNEYLTDKYLNQYIKNGENIKNKLKDRQAIYLDVMKYVDDENLLDNDENKQILKDKSIELLKKAKEDLPTMEEKDSAQSYIDRIENGESFADIIKNDSKLKYALIALYSGEDKINTIEKWISHVSLRTNGKPRGFTMTSGVWQADDFSKDPDYYIHNVGEVLCYGKRHSKGNVYYKTPNHYAKFQTEAEK